MDNKGAEQLLSEIENHYFGHHNQPEVMMISFMANVLDICDHLNLKIENVVKDAKEFREESLTLDAMCD